LVGEVGNFQVVMKLAARLARQSILRGIQATKVDDES
jgi:hypothetical protein